MNSAGGRWLVAVLAVQAAVYLLVIGWLSPPEGVELSDCGLRVMQAVSYQRHGLRRLDIVGPAQRLDPELRFCDAFTAPAKGRLYGKNSPFFPVLLGWVFGLVGARGLLLLPALAALGGTLLVYRLGVPWLGPSKAAAAAGLVALASPLLVYGQIVWEHSLAVALCLASLVLLPRNAVWAGVVAGLAVWLRTEEGLFGVAVAVALALEPDGRRRAGAWLLGYGPMLVVLGGIYTWLYGRPTGLHLAVVAHDRGSLGLLAWHHELVRRMVLPDGALVYGAAGLAVATLVWAKISGSRRADLLNAAVLLALAAAVVRAGAGSTAARALPWVLVLLRPLDWGWLRVGGGPRSLPEGWVGEASGTWPGSRMGWLLATIAGLFTVLVLAVSPAHAGECWGPRFLLPAVPLAGLLVVGAVAHDDRPGRRLTRGVLVLLVLLSAASQGRTIATLCARRAVAARLTVALRQAAEGTSGIATDAAMLPSVCPFVYDEVPMYVISSADDLAELLRRGEPGQGLLLVTADAAPWRAAGVAELTQVGRSDDPALELLRARSR